MSAKPWSFSAGTRPNTVRVYERTSGGLLHARAWDSTARNWVRTALGHRDKAKAKRYAVDQAAKLQKGEATIADGKVTLAHVFALYRQHKSPDKSKSEQRADVARVEMWTRVLGATMDPHAITPEQWGGFIRARTAGAIDARGRAVPEDKRKPLRARAPEADCQWLKWVFNWASEWRLSGGRYLMQKNPVRGSAFDIPTEKNPRRPLYTAADFKALRSVSDKHTMEIRTRKVGTVRGFDKVRARSYMSELLDICEGTARRIDAVCSLRYSDLHLAKTKDAPHGSIRWPGETDKEGREWSAPLSPRVRKAVERILKERPAVGSGYLFPAPGNPSAHVTTDLATRWLKEVEALAKVPHVEGRAFHGLRRKWATERKHLPDVDVAAAGGWRSLEALKRSYQHADAAGVLAVVLGGGELREAK